MRLSGLPHRTVATVVGVEDASPNDAVARRLRELGFVAGESVEVLAAGPFGAEPLLVRIGYTRFALRRREAERVAINTGVAASDPAPGEPSHARAATAETA